ncbi:hypothetical protein IMAU70023_00474 [Lactiplantibacillus plantarum]|nr:hypothetical protein [Lactiplantibacillus plantarum]MCG0710040.1 hypothetical protein [Lactiplantibacillus plantarum]
MLLIIRLFALFVNIIDELMFTKIVNLQSFDMFTVTVNT